MNFQEFSNGKKFSFFAEENTFTKRIEMHDQKSLSNSNMPGNTGGLLCQFGCTSRMKWLLLGHLGRRSPSSSSSETNLCGSSSSPS